MRVWRNALGTLVMLLIVADVREGMSSSAEDAVTVRVTGRYYMEPATVQIVVALAPHAENRVLRIEADGERFFRSADLPLPGARAAKFHTVSFRNLLGGHYVIRASVLSTSDVLARAEDTLFVVSSN